MRYQNIIVQAIALSNETASSTVTVEELATVPPAFERSAGEVLAGVQVVIPESEVDRPRPRIAPARVRVTGPGAECAEVSVRFATLMAIIAPRTNVTGAGVAQLAERILRKD